MSQDNININIQETNDIVNVVSSTITEVVDVNVSETIEEVTLNITEEVIQVNINKIIGGGGGSQSLADTLNIGNNTGGNDILLNNADAIQLENGSSLKKGTYDFGQQGGVSRICGVGYEDMWQGGIRHVFDSNGLIRNSSNGFNLIPNNSFDVTLRFKIGSIWSLDDGISYICTDATTGAAIWEILDNNYTTAEKTKVSNLSGTNTGDQDLSGKVDKVTGKELSTNDFTNTLKTKLDGIASGAEVNVNADWNATSGDAQILNKPTIPSLTGVELTANKQNSLATDGTGIKYPTVDAVNSGLSGVNTNSIRRDTVKLSQAINKGQAVYVSGANGTNILVSKASNTTEATSSKTIGLLETTGAINAIVNVVTDGLLTGLDTSTATIGDPVWLGVSGDLIYGLTNKPFAPAHLVYIGVVTRVNANNGEILIKVQNGFELKEIHDVAISSVADKQLLSYDSATSLWKNKSVTTADIAASTNKNYVTDANLTTIGNQSGTNTGDETTATIKTKLGAATTSADGYLTSANWNTFNSKLVGIHTLRALTAGQSTTLSINGAGLNTTAGTANRMTLIPYIPNVSFTSASLYMNVSTLLLTANARILIYSDVNNVPTTKLYESANLDCSTIGIKTATTAFSFVAGTTYWLAVHSSSTPTYSAYNNTQLYQFLSSGTNNYVGYISTQTFGSAPTTLTGTTLANSNVPFIGITF